MKWKVIFMIIGMLCVELVSRGIAAESFKIGIVLPMSGSMEMYGQSGWRGIQIAHKERSQVLNKEVTLLLFDDKSDSMEAADGISNLINQDKVDAIIGPLTSSASLASASMIEKAGVPTITPTATHPDITPNRKYFFRTCFSDTFQGVAAAKFVREHFKADSAAVLMDINEDYSLKLNEIFTEEFEHLGGQVVHKTVYIRGQEDFSKQLDGMINADPDLLYFPGFARDIAQFALQARQRGLTIPILTADGAESPDLVSIGGAAVEGLCFTTHFDPESVTTERGKQFLKAYQQAYPEISLDVVAALYYDAYILLLDTLEQIGTVEKEQVAAALAATKNFEGVTGVMTMNENHDMVKPVVIMTVKDGKFQWLDTVQP